MGRLAITLVLAAGIYLAQGYASSNETSHRTTEKQVEFEESALAREIARTGFNVAMGVLRSHGDDLQAGVNAVNGGAGYLEGTYQGGTYRVYARYTSGHSVEVVAAGYFGGEFSGTNTATAYNDVDLCATYVVNNDAASVGSGYERGDCYIMDDVYEYTLPTPPFLAQEDSELTVTFIQSMAGYCSALFMERMPADSTAFRDPEMIFPAGKNRDEASLTYTSVIEAGTQMNFFIAVDKNCSESQDWATFTPVAYNEYDYDHRHYAFVGGVTTLTEMEETVWSLIEQHPSDNQTWRIGWEDQHKTEWDNEDSSDPSNSFQALKSFGYDSDGWPTTDAWGYRELRDYGNRPDFSDQVVEIGLTPISESSDDSTLEEIVEVVTGGSDSDDGSSDGSTADDGSSTDTSTTELCGCEHQNKKKVLIRHFTSSQTNPFNDICIADSAVESHMDEHGDYVICYSN